MLSDSHGVGRGTSNERAWEPCVAPLGLFGTVSWGFVPSPSARGYGLSSLQD